MTDDSQQTPLTPENIAKAIEDEKAKTGCLGCLGCVGVVIVIFVIVFIIGITTDLLK